MTVGNFINLTVPVLAFLVPLTLVLGGLFAVRVTFMFKDVRDRLDVLKVLNVTLVRDSVTTDESPSWAEVVRKTEHGEAVAVLARGEHVADVVASGELDRLRETVDILSDNDLVRDLLEGLDDSRAGRVFSADDIAADLAARRAAGE